MRMTMKGVGHADAPSLFSCAVSMCARLLCPLMLIATALPLRAAEQGLVVTLPNGYANISAVDLSLQSKAGEVLWMRVWDGQEWKFNPHWESLSQSWKNMTGSQTADTTAGTVSGSGSSSEGGGALSSSSSAGGGDGGCWVWVDEDWQPSQVGSVLIGGLPDYGSMLSERTTPFNRIMGEAAVDYPPPVRVSVDYASLCAGSMISGGAVRDTEALRRSNELYLGDNGRYAFSNRAVLEKRGVRQLPELSAADWYAQFAGGQVQPAPELNPKGFRWMDKSGDWIDYNTQGQVVAWGDRNDNTIWLARDSDGIVRGVVDAQGRVLFSLHYNGTLISEVRDYPVSGLAVDLPARTVKYEYDERNRLVRVVDVRGNDSARYEYNIANRITRVTDAEGRSEQLIYNGDTVSRYIARDGAVTDYVFEYDDANKQFVSKISGPETEAGRQVEDYTHNRSSKLIRRIVNGQTQEEVRYDTANRVELNTNARGFTTRTTLNEFDQIVRIDYADGSRVQRSYSALNLQLTEEIDELGVKTQYEYDPRGNLSRKIEAAGLPEQRITEYQADAQGLVTMVTYKGRTEADGLVTPDAVWRLEYDAQGQVSRTIDPEGYESRYSYDRAGNLILTVDALGNSRRYDTDSAGNLSRESDALGRSRHYTYDRVGNATGFTDARGHGTETAFDAEDRPTRSTNPAGGVFRVTFNGQGLPVSEIDEDGVHTQAQFDSFLRLSRRVDGRGNTTQFAYTLNDGSEQGAPASLYEPTEIRYPTFTVRTHLDARERMTRRTTVDTAQTGQPDAVETLVHDKRGQLVSRTEAAGNSYSYRYDALGQLLETNGPNGTRLTATHDARGNLSSLTDAKGQSTRFRFDRNDRLVAEVLPLGQSTQYEYDAVGNLAVRTDASGNQARHRYDAANRLVETRYFKGSVVQRTVAYQWDDEDNLLAWTDIDLTRPTGQQESSGSAVYDAANRKTGETINYPDPRGGHFSLSYGYAYSPAGRRTTVRWPDGSEIVYGYSAHGQVQSVTLPGEGEIRVESYSWRQAARVALPAGAVVSSQYGGSGNLNARRVETGTGQTMLDLQNQFDVRQLLTQSTRADRSLFLRQEEYAYDAAARLTQVSHEGLSQSFTLDAVGNRTASGEGPWTYDANNRLLRRAVQGGHVDYEYDAAGSLVRKSEAGRVRLFAYDGAHRLTAVSDGEGHVMARYGYDPMGRRIWREQYRDRDGLPLERPLRSYALYADEGLLAVAEQEISLDDGGAVSSASAPRIQAQYGVMPGSAFTSGTLFVKTRASDGNEVVAYFHHDHRGAPIQASDGSGNILWSAAYDAWGRAIVSPPAEGPTITNLLRLPGQVEDDETGLHYNYRRYYDPDTGRYISADPTGLTAGPNTYLYAEGDPLAYIDPRGESSCAANCFLSQMGLPELGVAAGVGATGNFVDKPRTGIAGGGKAGNKTSVVSKIGGRFPIPVPGGGRLAGTRNLIRGLGRIGARVFPGVGAALLIYDAYKIYQCMSDCNGEVCKAR